MKDEDWFVRRSAAYALGEIGSDKAIDLLLPLMKDEVSYVRKGAADVLARISKELHCEHLLCLVKELPHDSEVLGQIKEAHQRRFLQVLEPEGQ